MENGRAEQMLGLSSQVESVAKHEAADIFVPTGQMQTGMGVATKNALLEAKVDALERALAQVNQANAAVFIPLDLIDANPWHPRRLFEEEPMRRLCESIKTTRGVLQPISVRKHPTIEGRYQLIAGERRKRACLRLELGVIAAVVLVVADADMAWMSLAENLVRENYAD